MNCAHRPAGKLSRKVHLIEQQMYIEINKKEYNGYLFD